MNKILKNILMAVAGMAVLVACQEKEPEFVTTEKGPDMTVESYSENVYMGANIKFSVNVSDNDFALSTLKARLLYDETEVNSVTIRTKENGVYEGTLSVPFDATTPDGIAEVEFSSQNVGLGITRNTVEVQVTRPNFDNLILTIGGNDYTMAKTDDYSYAVTDNFPADASGLVKTPAINEEGDVIVFGWSGTELAVDGADIPFANNKDGKYEISIDLKDLTAAPLGKLTVQLLETSNVVLINLTQGCTLDFSSIPDYTMWDWDYDFFTLEESNDVVFKAVDGLYKFNANFEKKFIKVEAMKDNDNLQTLAEDGSGAVWVIGGGIGKPSVGPSWNTDDGAYCMSQVSDKVYQFTMTAPGSLAMTGASFKFFGQKGWGVELKKENYAAFEDKTGIFIMTDGGNIEPDKEKVPEKDKSYCFTLDMTGGLSAAKLSIRNVDVPVSSLDIKFNGVQSKKLSATLYQASVLDLKKGDEITVTGVEDFASWYIDPDFFVKDGDKVKFNALDGKYAVNLYLDKGYMRVKRLKADGSDGATLGDHALWLMAWGLAGYSMTDGELAFNPGDAWCMAEVSPMVFQFTGKAVVSEDDAKSDEVGGRFRASYLSIKYFYQNGWGGEMKAPVFGPSASKLIGQSGNIGLLEGVTLEAGATYRLTIDLSEGTADGGSYTGTEKVELEKL